MTQGSQGIPVGPSSSSSLLCHVEGGALTVDAGNATLRPSTPTQQWPHRKCSTCPKGMTKSPCQPPTTHTQSLIGRNTKGHAICSSSGDGHPIIPSLGL